MKKMFCWMHRSSDSQVLVLRSAMWMPEGNKPEMDEHRWVRVSAMDILMNDDMTESYEDKDLDVRMRVALANALSSSGFLAQMATEVQAAAKALVSDPHMTFRAPRVPKEMAWKRQPGGDAEWYIPVGPGPNDHVRVWRLADKWYGALVLDGDYLFRIDAQKTDELAKAAIVERLKKDLSDILGVLP